MRALTVLFFFIVTPLIIVNFVILGILWAGGLTPPVWADFLALATPLSVAVEVYLTIWLHPVVRRYVAFDAMERAEEKMSW